MLIGKVLLIFITMEFSDDCLDDYKKAYPILNTNGDFLTNYGKALSIGREAL